MARRLHSASSVELGERCEYAYALTYLEGLREPEVEWLDIESGRVHVLPRGVRVTDPDKQCTPGQRSKSLGTAVHKTNECWYQHAPQPYADGSLPMKVALSGRGFLPHPDACHTIQVEHAIGKEPSGYTEADIAKGKLPTGLRVHGVLFGGKRDLVVQASHAELKRIGITSSAGGVVLVDYKTTSSIASYAKDEAELKANVQCCLYTLDVCEEFDLGWVPARWLYHETKLVRRALPIDVAVTRDQAFEVLAPAARKARELDELTEIAQATKNPRACPAFGGCSFHIQRGGPCDAYVPLSVLLNQDRKAHTKMDPKLQAKFDAAKAKFGNKGAAATTSATVAKAEPKPAAPKPDVVVVDDTKNEEFVEPADHPETEAPETDAPQAEAPEAEAPPATEEPKAKPKAKRGAAKTTTSVAEPGSKVAALLALQSTLAEKQAAVDVATAERDAVIQQIAEVAAA